MQFKPIWRVEPRPMSAEGLRIVGMRYVIVYADTGEVAGLWPMHFKTAAEAQALVDECHADAATAPKYR